MKIDHFFFARRPVVVDASNRSFTYSQGRTGADDNALSR
jgi:hypothetical protein